MEFRALGGHRFRGLGIPFLKKMSKKSLSPSSFFPRPAPRFRGLGFGAEGLGPLQSPLWAFSFWV